MQRPQTTFQGSGARINIHQISRRHDQRIPLTKGQYCGKCAQLMTSLWKSSLGALFLWQFQLTSCNYTNRNTHKNKHLSYKMKNVGYKSTHQGLFYVNKAKTSKLLDMRNNLKLYFVFLLSFPTNSGQRWMKQKSVAFEGIAKLFRLVSYMYSWCRKSFLGKLVACVKPLVISPVHLRFSGSGFEDASNVCWCITAGLILGLHPANVRRRYKVTPSLIGWAQT